MLLIIFMSLKRVSPDLEFCEWKGQWNIIYMSCVLFYISLQRIIRHKGVM